MDFFCRSFFHGYKKIFCCRDINYLLTELGCGLFPKFTKDYGLFRAPHRASEKQASR